MKRDSVSAYVHMKRDTPLPILDHPRAFNLPTRAFNLATRAFSLLTPGFELVTREFELVSRGFELVARNSCFTFPGYLCMNIFLNF